MIITPHNPQSITRMRLGPEVPIGITRSCLPYSCNLAPSYVPTHLVKEALETPRSRPPVEQLARKPKVTSVLLVSLSNDFRNHLENRIQLFWFQMILVY